jgi:hypothetical protein
MKTIPLSETLARLRGKHVAVVYQYVPPDSPAEVWYHVWGLGVMAYYGYGFEALGMPVKYIDVDSFIRGDRDEARNTHYVLSLVCGNLHISNWSLVPAVAFWRQAIPLPAAADALMASERKDISSLFARRAGLRCPDEYSVGDLTGLKDTLAVAKPRDYGSSKGLLIAPPAELVGTVATRTTPYIFQQFVPGIDVTVASIYDPILERHQVAQAIGYVPKNSDGHWTFDDRAKTQHRQGGALGEVQKVFFDLPKAIEEKIVDLIDRLGGSSLARVDFRVAAIGESDLRAAGPEVYSFLEINLCPTISAQSNFVASVRRAIDGGTYPLTPFHQEFFSRFPPETALNAFIVFSMVRYGDATSRCSARREKVSSDE